MSDSKVEQNRKAVAGKKKGSPKTGGRKKGTPNKKTSELMQILGSFNPVETLKEIIARTKDDALQAKICLDLLKYLYPQRKAIEMNAEDVKLPEINIKGI